MIVLTFCDASEFVSCIMLHLLCTSCHVIFGFSLICSQPTVAAAGRRLQNVDFITKMQPAAIQGLFTGLGYICIIRA